MGCTLTYHIPARALRPRVAQSLYSVPLPFTLLLRILLTFLQKLLSKRVYAPIDLPEEGKPRRRPSHTIGERSIVATTLPCSSSHPFPTLLLPNPTHHSLSSYTPPISISHSSPLRSTAHTLLCPAQKVVNCAHRRSQSSSCRSPSQTQTKRSRTSSRSCAAFYGGVALQLQFAFFRHPFGATLVDICMVAECTPEKSRCSFPCGFA